MNKLEQGWRDKVLNKTRRINSIEKTSKEHINYYVDKGYILNDIWTILGVKNNSGSLSLQERHFGG